MQRLLLKILLVLLFLPLAQQALQWVEINKLGGTDTAVEYPKFDSNNWLSANYQNEIDAYSKRNFGFRNFLVRLDNQVNYWLFGEIRVNNVLMGKEGYLFETAYLHAYNGTDFLDAKRAKEQVGKLKAVQDTLQQLGTKVLLVFAPSKGSFYPEHFPDNFQRERKTTNYEYYLAALEKTKLPYIDFNAWFREIKDTIAYPLFPKTGIHWSEYGSALAADSLIHFLQKKYNLPLPNMEWERVTYTNKLRGTDWDIEKAMNLLYWLPNDSMAYPKINFTSKTKDLKLIAIGDSFYWNWYGLNLPQKVFGTHEYWYYNKEVHPRKGKTFFDPKDYDWRKKLPEQDVIILIVTEPSLPKFAWEFVDLSYQAFFTDTYLDPVARAREREITAMEERIRTNEKWFNKLQDKAEKLKIPLEKVLRSDAIYMVDKK